MFDSPSRSSSGSLRDLEPSRQQFLEDVLEGLTADEKFLRCKYFYDARGSRLFDRICELDEYYLTRTELAITRQHAGEMAARLGERCMLVEYGSGSSVKIRILLDHLEAPAAYVPVEISREHLQQTADELVSLYPDLDVRPVCADFTEPFDLPEVEDTRRVVVYFPGSTIGNFGPEAAVGLLRNMAEHAGAGGGVLIGVDLEKPAEILEPAYDDAAGVTEQFNKNLLLRINTELDGDFDLDAFEHRAKYNPDEGRVEISLVSRVDQTVRVDDAEIPFAAGEPIHTEFSYKYSRKRFAEIAARAGLEVEHVWSDENDLFSVQLLRCA